ncbi:Calx-beta domain-containing protein [Bdellovibrio bacteriovorus]|uniref:Calx-beta domain-containing protein n=1 Tax=Bdellovibrio bacteriovorus TaxID=959 RepID=UPI003AA9269F
MKNLVRFGALILSVLTLSACGIHSSIEQLSGLIKPSYTVSAKSTVTSLTEGDVFHVDLQIENPRLIPTTIRWNIANGSTDFTISAGTIVLPSGSTMVTLNLPVLDDAIYEDNEDFVLSFSSDDSEVSISPSALDLTVQDNEAMPSVEFQLASETALESIGSQNVTLTLSGPSGFTSKVNYAIKGTSSVQAADHSVTSGTVTFNPLETSKTISLGFVDDAVMESTENLILELSSPDKVTIGTKSEYSLSILDNDTLDLTVVIEQSGSQTDPTYNLPIAYVMTFNRAIDPATLVVADLFQGGTAPTITWSLSTTDNRVYNLTATAVGGSGTVKPELPAGRVNDLLGNPNLASSSSDGNVTYIPAPAAFTISGITGGMDNTVDSQLSSGNLATVRWAASTAADSYDVTIYENDGTTVKCATVSVAAPATSYSFSGCALSLSTSYKASVVAHRANGYFTAATNNPFTFSTPAPLTVTVNQAGGQTDPAATLPVEFSLVFSRAIDPASLSSADITQNGTATGVTWTLSTLDNINYILRATVASEGTLVPFLDATKATDTLGNPNQASTSTDASVLYRQKPAAFNISGVTGGSDATQDNSLSSGLIPTVHWAASSNAESYDVTIFENDGTTVKCPAESVAAPATSYSFSGCTLTAGTSYKAHVVAHRPSAPSTLATNVPFTFTTLAALSVTINQAGGQADPTNSVPVNFTVIFNRAVNPATFTSADITHTGTATVTTWTVSTSDNIMWTVSASAISGEGTVIPSINAGVVQDTLANTNLASTSTDNSVQFLFNPSAFTISGITGGSDNTADNQLTSGLVATVNWNASTYAESYDVTVLENDGTTVKCALTNVSAPVTSHNFAACTLNASTTYRARVVAKRALASSVTATNSLYSFTTGAPLTVTVNQAGGQADPTYNLPINFTVVFNRAIDPATFSNADITQNGTAPGVTWAVSTSDNITWSLQATAATGSGTLVPSIAAAAVADPMGNSNAVSTSTDSSVTYNAEPATFNITGVTGGLDSTADNLLSSGDKATINWAASTAANNYEVTIFENDNTTVKCATQTIAAPATSYNFSACSLTLNTAYKARVVATRTNGTTRTATNSLYAFTTPTPLTVTIEQAGGQADPTSSLPVNFTVTFSRAIDPASISDSDFGQSGSATGVTYTLTTFDNTVYTLRAISVGAEGTIIPTLAAGQVTDTVANLNQAATSVDASVGYYLEPGAFNVSGITGGTDSTVDNSLASGQYATVNWSAATSADSYDITIRNNANTATVCATVNVAAPATSYNFATCALSAGTSYKVLAVAKRNVGVQKTATNSPYTFSRVADLTIVTFARNTGQNGTTSSLPVQFRITFSRAIDPATFTAADITETGTSSGTTWSISTSDNTIFIVSATAVTNPGTLRPSVAANAVQDTSGNNNTNTVTVTAGQAVTYAPPPGPFTISGITGGTDSTADNQLTNGTKATVNWGTSTNATSYQVTIFENDGATEKCPQQTVAAPATSYSFTSCTLNFGNTYRARVRAVGGSNLDASNSLYSFTTATGILITVTPAYPTNGAKWNDYIKNDNSTLPSYLQADTACDGTETNGFRSCLHGGEFRKANMPSQPNCTGVTAADSLDVFDWACDDRSGNAVIYSLGLKANKGLRQMLNETSFMNNTLTVSVGGNEVAQSASGVWWTNTVQLAPSAASATQTLSTAGTIYTIGPSNSTGRGYNINADKISLVTLFGMITPAFSSWPLNTDATTGETGSGIRTNVAAGSQKFIWIETNVWQSSSGTVGTSIFLHNVTFSQVRNITDFIGDPTLANGRMIAISGSHSIQLKDITSDYNSTAANCHTLHISNNSGKILVQNLNLEDAPKVPILIAGPSAGNEFNVVNVMSWYGVDRIFDLNSVTDSAFLNVVGNSYGPLFQLTNSSGNLLANIVSNWNNTSSAMLLSGSTNNRIISYQCDSDYGSASCLTLQSGSNSNVLHNLAISAGGNAGMVINGSNENIITKVRILGNGNTPRNISLVSAHRNVMTHITSSQGSFSGSTVEFNASTYNTVNNLVAAVALYGLNMISGSDNNRFAQTHFAGDDFGTNDIRINGSSNNQFTKFFTTMSGSYTHCNVSGGTNPGVTHSTCAASGSSTYTYIPNVNSSGSFNASLELNAADTALRDRVQNGNSANSSFVNGALCPAGLDPASWTITDQRTSPTTFLINAYEEVFDDVGNNNGLCEANEACTYAPNFGAYQGHGDYRTLSCTMPAGAFQANTIYAYPTNGY